MAVLDAANWLNTVIHGTSQSASVKLHRARVELVAALKQTGFPTETPAGKPRNSKTNLFRIPVAQTLEIVPYTASDDGPQPEQVVSAPMTTWQILSLWVRRKGSVFWSDLGSLVDRHSGQLAPYGVHIGSP